MGKITKKVIASQAKFILIIDRKTEFTKPYEPIEIIKLESNGIIESMIDAEKYIDDTVYLASIAEKTDEVTEEQMLVYNEILINRTNGWRVCDNDHCEQPYKYGYSIEFDLFENLGQIK